MRSRGRPDRMIYPSGVASSCSKPSSRDKKPTISRPRARIAPQVRQRYRGVLQGPGAHQHISLVLPQDPRALPQFSAPQHPLSFVWPSSKSQTTSRAGSSTSGARTSNKRWWILRAPMTLDGSAGEKKVTVALKESPAVPCDGGGGVGIGGYRGPSRCRQIIGRST